MTPNKKILFSLIALFFLFVSPVSASANLISNGDFETGTLSDVPPYPWSQFGTSGMIKDMLGYRTLFMGSASDCGVQQSFTVSESGTATLSFFISQYTDDSSTYDTVYFYVDNEEVYSRVSNTVYGWDGNREIDTDNVEVSFHIESGTHILTIEHDQSASWGECFIDDVVLVVDGITTDTTGSICINQLEDLDDTTGVPFYVEVTPSFDSSRSDYEYYFEDGYTGLGQQLLFDEDTLKYYTNVSGTYSSMFSVFQKAEAGTYTAKLYEHCYDSSQGDLEFEIATLNYTVYSSSSGGETPIGGGVIDLPDSYEDWRNSSSVTYPVEDLDDNGDYTNTTALAPYYNTVYGIINGMHTTVAGLINWLLTPIYLIIEYVGYAVSIGDSVLTSFSSVIAPVGIILRLFFNSIPSFFIHAGSLILFFALYKTVFSKGESD